MKKITILLLYTLCVLLCDGCAPSQLELNKEKIQDTWISLDESTGTGYGIRFYDDDKANFFNTNGDDTYGTYTITESLITIDNIAFDYHFDGDDLVICYDGNEQKLEKGGKLQITTLVQQYENDAERIIGYWKFTQNGSTNFLHFDEVYGVEMKSPNYDWLTGSYYLFEEYEELRLAFDNGNSLNIDYYFTDDDHVDIGEWSCERITKDEVK